MELSVGQRVKTPRGPGEVVEIVRDRRYVPGLRGGAVWIRVALDKEPGLRPSFAPKDVKLESDA